MSSRHLLLALVLPACAASQRPTSARPPRRFVLVTQAAALRTAPDASGEALTLTHPGPFVFRRVRLRGEVVELETVAAPERQCAAAIVPPAGMRLRFFTTTRALGQAVARPLYLSGPEGSLTVAVGTPVRETADGVSLEVAHAGLRVSLREVPPVARAFAEPHAEAPVERAERLGPGTHALLPEGAAVTVGDDAQVLVFLRSAMLQGSRVVVATPCVRFEGTVPSSAVLPVLDMELGDASRVRLPRRVIRAGARLVWPDGGPAGRTVAAVPMADEGSPEGARRCFRVALRVHRAVVEPPPEVTVCAAATDVQETDGEL